MPEREYYVVARRLRPKPRESVLEPASERNGLSVRVCSGRRERDRELKRTLPRDGTAVAGPFNEKPEFTTEAELRSFGHRLLDELDAADRAWHDHCQYAASGEG